MEPGFVEVITLLLGISGFSVQQNPQAPTPEASLQYAMPDADVVMHFDAGAVVPNNYKVLMGLPNTPGIKASPDLAKMVRKVIGEVEGGRGLAKAATGIDLATDVNDATVFFRIVPNRDPSYVAVMHGKFSAMNIEKIAKMKSGLTVLKVGDSTMVDVGDENAVAVTKDGTMIAGTVGLVKERAAATWKAPTRAPNSNLAYAAEILGQKPVFSLVMTLSPTARKEAATKIGGKNLGTDILQRHKLASVSVFHDGVGWTWIDSNRAGLDAMELMSQGVLELMKAGHIAPRGMAKLMLGGLESYKGTNRQIDDVLRRKAEVMKVVETYTGDGNFKQTITKDPKTLRLTVRAQGKSLSEVVPAGFLLPAGAFLMLGSRGAEMGSKAPVMVAPPAPGPAPKPALGGKKN
ncbi:MAG: hypothetical protein ACKV2T_24735 [Kofleriaceae bacterium]